MDAGDPINEALKRAESTGELSMVSLVNHWSNHPHHQQDKVQGDDASDLPQQERRNHEEEGIFVSSLTGPHPSIASSLHTLDLSRNLFQSLPDWICTHLVSLKHLNVSRNSLIGLPTEICNLQQLESLEALSNNFRPRLLPVTSLTALPNLKLLDLRYCSKLKESTQEMLSTKLSDRVELLITSKPTTINPKLSAGERDPTLLRSQLEPLSTPQLRKRLERTFGIYRDATKEEGHDREALMQTLLDCYEKELASNNGQRWVRQERGIPCPATILQELETALIGIEWPQDRERPKISAQHYMILQRPSSNSGVGPKARKEAAKLQRYLHIWELAELAIRQIDKEFADRFTALAVTKNFNGSPHIDTLNVGPFYGISMGEFSEGGGKICVECSALVVAEVDTRGRFGKVDGRFPHWVSPYEGTRYSLIYYVTSGEVIPQTISVFPPRDSEEAASWVPPETFVL